MSRVARIGLKRVYEAPSPDDGTRILVERLWPRGLSKERAAVDVWLKDVAPSPALRTWYGHDPAKWTEFRRRYRDELRSRPDELQRLEDLVRLGPVTFVYAARDPERNSARVLMETLEAGRAGAEPRPDTEARRAG